MLEFFVKRFFYMVLTVFLVSIVAFIIIQIPPGDYLSTYIATLRAEGATVDQSELEHLKKTYGLGKPIYIQYYNWITGIITRGDFGMSFEWQQPVKTLMLPRFKFTLLLSLSTVLFTWIVAFPIGVYSATHPYSIGDYIVTFIGFLGLSIPNFLLAIVLMWYSFDLFGMTSWGLISTQFANSPWSTAKIFDVLKHLIIPVIVVGTAGTAGLIRILRANLLDELHKPYVNTAKAKGVPGTKLLWKYPVRLALIPFVSVVGWTLPRLISGAVITSVVLSLPTAGPLFLRALISQDMYLAGTFVLLVSTLTILGTFISDLLLVWVDPRIRYN